MEKKRELDVQKVCNAIINMYPKSTGDYGTGAECPFCGYPCRWDAESMSRIEHSLDCVYLVAKDLSTGINITQLNKEGGE